jgi:hypothetical protein
MIIPLQDIQEQPQRTSQFEEGTGGRGSKNGYSNMSKDVVFASKIKLIPNQ